MKWQTCQHKGMLTEVMNNVIFRISDGCRLKVTCSYDSLMSLFLQVHVHGVKGGREA